MTEAANGGPATSTDRPLTVLFAPDSFKGSLTSVEVAAAIAYGWSRARPTDTVLQCPLADGGEGTLEAVADSAKDGSLACLVQVRVGLNP